MRTNMKQKNFPKTESKNQLIVKPYIKSKTYLSYFP